MLLPLAALLSVLTTVYANVMQVDDPTAFLPSDARKANDFPDETQINHAELKVRTLAVDKPQFFDTSTCAKCRPGEEFEKGSHGSIISCNCVVSEFFQDDIKLAETTRNIVTKLFMEDDDTSNLARGFTSLERLYWPKGSDGRVTIPYRIESGFQHNDVLEQAFEQYTQKTCIRFVERTSQKDYISIGDHGGCWAYVGRILGRQEVSLGDGCGHIGVIEHELMHVLGFFHEQSRPDRDQYVEIRHQNIIDNFENNFEKMTKIDSGRSAYDIGSVMHYGEYAFSKNREKTIVVKSNPRNVKVGQRDGFADSDIEQINAKYCGGSVQVTAGTTTRPTTTATTKKPTEECKNLYDSSNCDFWAQQGYCDVKFVSFMNKNCKKSCKGCESSVTPAPVCRDKIVGCSSWEKYCKLTQFEEWMNKQCPATCGACHSSEVSFSSTAIRSTTVAVETVRNAQCGRAKIVVNNYKLAARIAGGVNAAPGTVPWQASIRFGKRIVLCGGSWIGGEWILTAAQCVKPKFTNRYTVYLGLHWRRPNKHDGSNHVAYNVEEVIVHEGYDKRNMRNDIALIRLTKPVQSTNYIIPVCLPEATYDIEDGAKVSVSGWGDTTEKNEGHAESLMKVDLNVIDRDTCRNWMQPPVYDSMMCAGYEEGGRDACQGDDGGPLTEEIDGRHHQVGIVSWGFGCGREEKPGVYTMVSYFREWINNKSGI